MPRILSEKLLQILTILNDGQYHDGDSIGLDLKITRSAVWKNINKLKSYGINISSTKGKGYRMLEPFTLLNKENILNGICDVSSKINLEVAHQVESTNDSIKEFEKSDCFDVLLAEMQTEGRGRLGKTWHSPFGKNIYLSCRFLFKKDLSELAGLSLCISLAMNTVLKELGICNAKVKWPNDLLINDQKCLGTLVEVVGESNGQSRVIIGVGLNVNMQNSDEVNIEQPWTSLELLTHKHYDRDHIASLMVSTLYEHLNLFQNKGLSTYLDEWKENDYLFNKQILLQYAETLVKGIGQGITNDGHLLVKDEKGDLLTFSSGYATVID